MSETWGARSLVGALLVFATACREGVQHEPLPLAEAGNPPAGPNTEPTRADASDGGTSAIDSGADFPDSGTEASRATISDASVSDSPLANDAGTDTGTTGPLAAADSAAPSDESDCLDGIDNYAKDGPFAFATSQSGKVKLWVPAVAPGCKVPIVHFANGTGASCSNYQEILERLATHGFLATCYEDTSTAEGTQCLTALETARLEHPELAAMKVGSAGHEQGGGAALLCLYRAEQKWGDTMIYAGHAMIPVSGLGGATPDYQTRYAQIKAPVFMFTASADMLVPQDWVRKAYDALESERYWYEATGATHLPIPLRWAQESAVAWFRWKLLGDEAAGSYFKHMPDSDDWELIASAPQK